MATKRERVQGIIQGLLGAWVPTRTAIKMAKDATEYMDEQGLLMPDEDERLPSWGGGAVMIRTTQDWVKELARSKRGTPMHTAVSEVVRLRGELEAMQEDWERAAERAASARDSHEHPAKAAYARHLQSHQNVIRRLTRILEADNE